MTMQVIQHIELGSTQASIDFNSIPQTYTDLLILLSLGSNQGLVVDDLFVYFNGQTSTYSYRVLFGAGSGSGSSASTSWAALAIAGASAVRASASIYIPNYRSSAQKSMSIDTVQEANQTEAYQTIQAGLWNGTSAISSISLDPRNGTVLVAGSSATLYGITAGSDGTTTVS